jgi:hypothetical protein
MLSTVALVELTRKGRENELYKQNEARKNPGRCDTR